MKFIFRYPDYHGTAGEMLDDGPVAELAVTADARWRRSLGQISAAWTVLFLASPASRFINGGTIVASGRPISPS